MSEHRSMWASAVALCIAAAHVAGAQDARVLEAQVTTSAQRFLTVVSTVRAYDDSVARLNAALDTVTVGAIRLSASPRVMSVARQGAAIAERELRARLGSTVSRLAPYGFVVRQV